MELTRIVARLNEDPLTHLMLGHRELFHSNLLAWFFEQFPTEADKIFGSFANEPAASPAARGVQREFLDFDLLLQWPDRRSLLIENKVFSYPDEQQLSSYGLKASARKLNPRLCLLSLSNPNWINNRKTINGHEWTWISYRQLAKDIREAFAANKKTYAVETMSHYADVVDLLSDLADQSVVTSLSEPVGLPSQLSIGLSRNRLLPGILKLRAWSVVPWIERELRNSGAAPQRVEAGYSNGAPHVTWLTDIGDGVLAGWQLQNTQFRLVVCPNGARADTLEGAFEFARANSSLFDFSLVDEALGAQAEATMPTKKEFCRYGNRFLYRYKNVSRLTVGQLQQAAVAVSANLRTP